MLPSRNSWPVALRYAGPPLAAGAALTVTGWRAGAGLIAAGLGILWFFRDPARPVRVLPGTAYSPADGRILLVENGVPGPWPGGPWLRIAIFMRLQDVHVARFPVAGTLVSWDWLDGRRLPAMSPRAAENRQARLVIAADGGGQVRVIVAAGLIARKITALAAAGDRPGAAGELPRAAIVHFGSRAELLLPAAAWEPLARPGARVRAGLSPLARLRAT